MLLLSCSAQDFTSIIGKFADPTELRQGQHAKRFSKPPDLRASPGRTRYLQGPIEFHRGGKVEFSRYKPPTLPILWQIRQRQNAEMRLFRGDLKKEQIGGRTRNVLRQLEMRQRASINGRFAAGREFQSLIDAGRPQSSGTSMAQNREPGSSRPRRRPRS